MLATRPIFEHFGKKVYFSHWKPQNTWCWTCKFENVRHIAQNAGHTVQKGGHTIQNVSCKTWNIHHNIQRASQEPPLPLSVKKLWCLELSQLFFLTLPLVLIIWIFFIIICWKGHVLRIHFRSSIIDCRFVSYLSLWFYVLGQSKYWVFLNKIESRDHK